MEPVWSYIYFVQAKSGGPIKIGCTEYPRTRLATLQNGNPEELVLRGVFYGTQKDERKLHQQLAASRARGEWFNPTTEVLLLVSRATVQIPEPFRPHDWRQPPPLPEQLSLPLPKPAPIRLRTILRNPKTIWKEAFRAGSEIRQQARIERRRQQQQQQTKR